MRKEQAMAMVWHFYFKTKENILRNQSPNFFRKGSPQRCLEHLGNTLRTTRNIVGECEGLQQGGFQMLRVLMSILLKIKISCFLDLKLE